MEDYKWCSMGFQKELDVVPYFTVTGQGQKRLEAICDGVPMFPQAEYSSNDLILRPLGLDFLPYPGVSNPHYGC
jgi:hypothetical protein